MLPSHTYLQFGDSSVLKRFLGFSSCFSGLIGVRSCWGRASFGGPPLNPGIRLTESIFLIAQDRHLGVVMATYRVSLVGSRCVSTQAACTRYFSGLAGHPRLSWRPKMCTTDVVVHCKKSTASVHLYSPHAAVRIQVSSPFPPWGLPGGCCSSYALCLS